jgi:hypothetical protein
LGVDPFSFPPLHPFQKNKNKNKIKSCLELAIQSSNGGDDEDPFLFPLESEALRSPSGPLIAHGLLFNAWCYFLRHPGAVFFWSRSFKKRF